MRLGGRKQRAVLALLLLEEGHVVAADRLIDELWGLEPPEDAPTALQAHVSRLRRALPDGPAVLATQPPGYVLRIGDDQLDAQRFRRLVAAGRAALEDDRNEEAAERLREALRLWRGRALEDLREEDFAVRAAGRLEEERLEALELRVEADLRLGRHHELLPELGALAQQQPLRERLAAQRMLALYRSGRQAEALEAYAQARRVLVAELGLEPGPELQRLQGGILSHDPELRPPTRSRRAPPRRRRLGVVAAAAALAVAGAAIVGARTLGDEQPPSFRADTGGGHVLALDATTGAVRRRIDVGRSPAALAAQDGAVWLVDADAGTVLHVAETSRVIEALSIGATPTDVAVGEGSVWIGSGRPLAGAQFVGAVATAVARLDPATRTRRGEIDLPHGAGATSNLVDNHLAVAGDAVWAVTPDSGLARIDAASGTITAVTRALPVAAVASGPAGIWALGVHGEVARLDPRSARPLARARVPDPSVAAIAVGDDAAWVAARGGTLWRVGGGPGRLSLGAIDLAPGLGDVAVGAGSVWVVNPLAGTLSQVDARTATLVRTVPLDGIPRSVAVDGSTVWVALTPGPRAAVTEEVSGIRALPPSMCEPVVAGEGGEADLLVVSDLPLQGGIRITALQMVQAMTFVLRERGFRAGRFRVAYQACDDSLGRTGLFDEAKCAANARAYAGNPDVAAVIGTLNSPCAVAALPELNRAPDGPLAMISPLNSFVGLTRPGPGIDPALPAALYPTGRRNYVRVYPTDDLQGAALALFARDRGHRRVVVLDDGEPGYGVLMARGFETAARRLGLTIAGRARWRPTARGYAGLADRVAGARPGAVFLGGLLDTNGARVVRALRARLGPSVDLLLPDGFTPIPLLVQQAGAAALGAHVSLAGVVTERLPARGARFAARFAGTQAGAPVEPSAVYAAQATEVLLDAIARSDGSRPSIVAELFATRVRDGLLGTFRFDANGDITESPVTILGVRRAGASRTVGSVEGGEVERVVRPRTSLVRGGE